MDDPSDRLKRARADAGFENASAAARAFGWNEVTYRAHEGGGRGLRPDVAARYARALRVPADWLLYGPSRKRRDAEDDPATVPLVGYVGAGAQAHFADAQGPLDEVPAPEGRTDHTKAVEIRGDSLGPFFDRWIVYYDDVRRPVTADLIGPLCVVGLPDGRVLLKKIQRSRSRGLFHLTSQFDPPILDVPVEWAAKVKTMAPR